ncbi:MAG: alpha/beta fold hydrolase [Acetobacteraceae bacterium]
MPIPQPSQIVARAWRQVLDGRSLEADVPFDQAGGDSLRLLKLIFLLEEYGGVRLPMEACHVGLRPSGFADVLGAAMRVASRDGATEPPGTVFLIPGMGGVSQLVGGFAAACAPRLRIAIIDLPDWPDLIAPQFSMADLVERCAAEIQERAADGPLHIAGFSLGGHVALGVAHVLLSRGHRIGFLGVLDTNAAWRRRSSPDADRKGPLHPVRRLRWEMHNLLTAAREGRLVDRLGMLTAEVLAQPGKAWRLRLAASRRHARLPAGFWMFVNKYLREILQARTVRSWQADRRQTVPLLDVPAVLFRSQEHEPREPDDLGWGALCPGLRIVHVAGGHEGMMRPPHLDDFCDVFIRESAAAPVKSAPQLVA